MELLTLHLLVQVDQVAVELEIIVLTQELLELQTSWAKSATEAYLAEVTKATDIMTASVKDSFKPINERVTASVEKFQAAR